MDVPAKPSRFAWSAVGLLIGGVLLALVLTRLDLGEAWTRLTQLDPRRLLLPLAITLIAVPVRPWRWRFSFPPQHRPRFAASVYAFYLSLMVNNIAPARGGDVLRCFLIGRDRSLHNASRVLGTLALEKLLDGLALLAVVTLSLFFVGDAVWLTRLAACAGLIFIAAFVAFWLLQRRPDLFQRIIQKFVRILRRPTLTEKIDTLFVSLTEGLSAVGQPRRLCVLLLATALVWALEAAFVWAMAAAVAVPLSYAAAALVTAVLGLGLMIPAAPGYIGTYEFFTVAVLGLFGIAPENALALTLSMHAWVLITTTGLGLVALAASGLKLSSLLTPNVGSAREIEEPKTHGE